MHWKQTRHNDQLLVQLKKAGKAKREEGVRGGNVFHESFVQTNEYNEYNIIYRRRDHPTGRLGRNSLTGLSDFSL
jgi:hypothetical protein